MSEPTNPTDFRVPPHNDEAEQALLGGIMIDPLSWDRIGEHLQEKDFYHLPHGVIFACILQLMNNHQAVDALTVSHQLELSGTLERAGGMSYIAQLSQRVASSANIHRYAEIIRDMSVMRQLVEVGTGIVERSFNPLGREARTLLDEAEASVFRIAEQNAHASEGFVKLAEPLSRVVDYVNELHSQGNNNPVTGVATGFIDLDRKTAGFQRDNLIIIAGRPSMGKTAFALNIATHVATKEALPVAIFSMEMSGQDLAMRILSAHAHIDQTRLRTGQLTPEDFARIPKTLTELDAAPLYIDESPALNPLDLRSRARRLYRQYGDLGLIIVDYLQLMSGRTQGENRATEISEISRSLKALAKELHVPVVALSQLNRAVDSRPDKRPLMSDLRESGAIEQDADLILFIYRDEVYNKDSAEKGKAEINIGKQRNGPIGSIDLTFLGQYTRFENYAQPSHYSN
jgi:replicative DNA helicase